MEPVKFQIVIESPIGLTIDLQKDIHCSILPKYRLLGLELRWINQNAFHLTALFHPEDISPQTNKSELFKIRDRLLALISITAMVPVALRSKGIFTFPLGEGKFQQLSLGPMNREASPVALHSLQPLVEGQSLHAKYAAAVYFIWQAINADESLYRFINTAICVELLTGADSLESSSINPKCTNNTCSYILKKCPECNRDWATPNSLRNRAKFLIQDEGLLSRFIEARNKVFHGASRQQDAKFLDELAKISVPVLLSIRNYIGSKIGLSPMEEKDLSIAFHDIDIIMSVFFTIPEAEPKE
jgi:hypothetical protein